MRAFIAVELTDSKSKDNIIKMQEILKSTDADLKLVAPENLHFTIRFLGEISPAQAEETKERMKSIEVSKFPGRYLGLGTFPSLRRISVIWIGVDHNASINLRRIADEVNRKIGDIGTESDRRFEPHLTISRVKTPRNVDALVRVLEEYRDTVFGNDIFSALKLKKSELTPSGPIYSDIYGHEFLDIR